MSIVDCIICSNFLLLLSHAIRYGAYLWAPLSLYEVHSYFPEIQLGCRMRSDQ